MKLRRLAALLGGLALTFGVTTATFANEINDDPGIHVEKTASVETLPPEGGSVTYTYVVANAGNVPLSDVSVSDDKCSPVTYVSGDANDDDFLDLGESWTFTCTANITEDTTNTAVVTGHDGEDTVTDDDTAIVTVDPHGALTIHLEKTVAPLTLPAGGGDVTYTYVVSNPGGFDLHDVSVTDDNGTPSDGADDFVVECPQTTLAVDEEMTCTADVEGIVVTTTNIAMAEGIAGYVFDGVLIGTTDRATVTVVGSTDGATVTDAPDGGVAGETYVPEAPQTDAINSSGDAGNTLPILLAVLGIVGIAAVVLTPARARRR